MGKDLSVVSGEYELCELVVLFVRGPLGDMPDHRAFLEL